MDAEPGVLDEQLRLGVAPDLQADRQRTRVTAYEEDQEAYDLWKKHGLTDERITRLGQKSNYWPANAIMEQSQGPCGPCSEIFFDLQPDQPFDVDWDGEGMRWLEIWNNVFTQFTGQGTGPDYKLVPLKNKNIDTGMGLERTAAAINNLSGPFETDVLRPIIAHLENLSGKTYSSTPDSPVDIAFRRIADHVRATTFLIGDGVTPGNSKHGYVLRRLMRRGIVAGRRNLGFGPGAFLDRAVPGFLADIGDGDPQMLFLPGAEIGAGQGEHATLLDQSPHNLRCRHAREGVRDIGEIGSGGEHLPAVQRRQRLLQRHRHPHARRGPGGHLERQFRPAGPYRLDPGRQRQHH